MLILTYVIVLSVYSLYRTEFIEIGDWILLEYDPSDKIQKILIEQGDHYCTVNFRAYKFVYIEMYYLNNFGGCYTLIYAFGDEKENNVSVGKIRYDQSVDSELTTVYEFIYFEMIMWYGDIHIHNPLYITIQKSIIEYLMQSNTILSYLNRIQRYGLYYIVYIIQANQMNRIMIGKYENEEFRVINRFLS